MGLDIVQSDARNSRLDSINAAVLSAKLKLIDLENQKRQKILELYVESFSDFEFFPYKKVAQDNVAHLAVGRTKNPQEMINFYLKNGIELSRHYPIPDSEQKGLNYLGILSETPVTRKLCAQVVSIPIYPWLTEDQISQVCLVSKMWCEINV